ncbi:MAG: VTT domain-containing protein [Betaproteobacteria bacterium]
MKVKRLLLVFLVIGLGLAFIGFDLGRLLSLDYFKSQQAAIEAWRSAQPMTAALCFFLTYIIVTGLSLPGATVMSLAIGAVFGLYLGVLLVSFAASIGATLAFLTARFLLRDWVQLRFGIQLRMLNTGIEKDGGFYLFTLRLMPVFPFFIINLLMGLTPIRTRIFYVATQTGMLAANLIFVNAGTQLAKIDSLSGILSPSLIASLTLLGIFPLLARALVNSLVAKRTHSTLQKPGPTDAV